MTSRERGLLEATIGWRLTPHAREVAMARGFGIEQVLLACIDPVITYTAYDYGPGRHVHQRDLVSVVVNPEARIVITVLLRACDDWTDADARRINQSFHRPSLHATR